MAPKGLMRGGSSGNTAVPEESPHQGPQRRKSNSEAVSFASSLATENGVENSLATLKEQANQSHKTAHHEYETGSNEVESGVQRLDRVMQRKGSIMGYVERDSRQNGLRPELLLRMAFEEEWQIASCASLPFTILFFVIFMLFFQQHYGVTDIYLAEKNFRSELGKYAVEIMEPIEIYDWLGDRFFPFMWGALPNASFQYQRDSVSLYQELVGGVTLQSRKALPQLCENKVVDDMNCFTGPDDGEGGTDFDGVSLNSRLLSSVAPRRNLSAAGSDDARKDVRMTEVAAKALDTRQDRTEQGVEEDENLDVGDEEPDAEAEPTDANVGVLVGRGAELPRHRVPDWGRASKRKASNRRNSAAGGASAESGRWKSRLPQLPDNVVELPEWRQSEKMQRQRRLLVNRPEIRPNVGGTVVGKMSEMLVPASVSLAEAIQVVQEMRDVEVFQPTTVTFSAQAVVLSKNLPGRELLSHVDFTFSFSRGGGVFCQVGVVTLVLDEDTDIISVFLGPCWLVCLMSFSVLLPIRAYGRFKEGKFAQSFFKFWNLLEWSIVVVGWLVVGFWLLERIQITALKKTLEEFQAARSKSEEFTDEQRALYKEFLDQTMAATFTSSQFTQVAVAQYHVLLIFRFFLAIRGQPRLAIVLTTVRKASVDLLHLAVVITIIFMAYGVSGHVLFGRRMQEYATFQGAISDCFQIVMERQFNWEKFSEQDLFTSLIWVWSFTMLVTLVLVNIFLAMIFDCYGDVRSSVGDAATLWRTTKHLLSNIKNKLKLHKEGDHWVPNSELTNSLKRMNVDSVTPWMLKDALPGISNKQVNYLFNMAFGRMENEIMRANRDSLPAVVASILLGIETLFSALGHFDTATNNNKSDEAFEHAVQIDVDGDDKKKKKKKSPFDCDPSAKPFEIERPKPISETTIFSEPLDQDSRKKLLTSTAKPFELQTQQPPLEAAIQAAGHDPSGPPPEPPQWVVVQLLPHLLKQTARLHQVHAQVKVVTKAPAHDCLGKYSAEAPAMDDIGMPEVDCEVQTASPWGPADLLKPKATPGGANPAKGVDPYDTGDECLQRVTPTAGSLRMTASVGAVQRSVPGRRR